MKRFTTKLTVHKASVLLLIQSILVTQGVSVSRAKAQGTIPVLPPNELSGPTLKFHSAQQALQDQQSKPTQPDVIKDVCDRYDVDGCSIPFHWPFFFKKLFTPSCDRHDICYHCGISRGITRDKCDQTFKDNMRKACIRHYEDKPWNSRSSYKSDKETKEHRITMQQLIEDKTQVLTALMKNVTHEIKKDIGDTLRLLTSPDKVKLLRKNVLLKWALLLSELVRGSGKSGESDSIDNKKRVLLKRHALFKRSTANHHKTSVEIFDATAPMRHGIDTKASSPGTPGQEDLCTVILKVADGISIHYQHYRISDVLDCEDISRLECLFTSELYYTAVHEFGGSSYRKTAEYYCNEGFVNACLPQS